MKYKLEKIYAWIKCISILILNDGLLRFLSWFLYPTLIYPTRSIVRYFWHDCGKFGKIISFIGFIFLNDPEEDGKNDDYGRVDWRKSIGFEKDIEEYNFIQKWFISVRWSSWRNPTWNAHRFFKPKYNDHSNYSNLDPIINDAYYYLTEWAYSVSSMVDIKPIKSNSLSFCTLKYKFEDGTEADNFGTVIDYEKSILGKNFVYYRVNEILYFRYSFAWVIENKAREFQIGTNGRRFKIRNKIKTLKSDCILGIKREDFTAHVNGEKKDIESVIDHNNGTYEITIKL